MELFKWHVQVEHRLSLQIEQRWAVMSLPNHTWKMRESCKGTVSDCWSSSENCQLTCINWKDRKHCIQTTFGWYVGVVISHNPMSMIDNNNMIQATNMIFLVIGKRKSNKVQNFQSRSSINPYKCSFIDRNVQNKNNKGRALSNINCSDFVCS